MEFNNREWTAFALDAEVEHFGTARIAKAHNQAVLEQSELKQQFYALELGLDELRRTTTPIKIDEHAKDGRLWLVLYAHRREAIWGVARCGADWWIDATGFRISTPTHYLPLPLPEVVE